MPRPKSNDFSAPKAPRRKFWVILGVFRIFDDFWSGGPMGGGGGMPRPKKLSLCFRFEKKIVPYELAKPIANFIAKKCIFYKGIPFINASGHLFDQYFFNLKMSNFGHL